MTNLRTLVFVLLASAGTAGAVGSVSPLEQIQPHLFLYRDSCNVYVLQQGTAAILIDLGSGRVLDRLASAGVTRVEAIYLTHRDRDQWFGFSAAEERRIPIHAPATDPDKTGYTSASIHRYWSQWFPVPNSRLIYSMVTRETDYPQADVADGAVLNNSVATLRAVATPGHTNDHMAYLAKLNGQQVAFTGDLIYSQGRIWQGYQLDWDHWRGLGYEAEFRSLLKVKDEHPDLILPSHGKILRGPNIDETLLLTADRVWDAAKLKDFELFAAIEQPPILRSEPLKRIETAEIPGPRGRRLLLERLSQHLWLTGNNYFLVAEDGSCFAVDNNLPPESWAAVLHRIGAKKVDYLWITHLHSDHVRQIPDIKRLYGPKIFTLREMADLLEHPDAYLHPYANFEPVKPDRVLEDRDEFTWKGYRFRVHFAPGQTWFHSFLETAIDGHHAVFSGDSYFPVREWDLANGTGGWSGLNRGFPSGHARSARLMISLHPDWVLAEHRMPFFFNEREWEYRDRWGREAARALDALSPSGNHRWDFNPHVFGVYPLISKSGGEGTVELRVENPFDEPMSVEFHVGESTPAAVEPARRSLTVSPGSVSSRRLHYRIRSPNAKTRYVIPIEITARGRYLGEACYFLVDTLEKPE